MRYFFLVFVSIFSFQLGMAQEYVKHKVEKSETITQIAKKYSVTPFDIYRLNPDARNGIRENDLLLIPSRSQGSKPTAVSGKPKTHYVQPGETLFSIARKYEVSVPDLEKVNADLLKDGLKSGQTISIPGGTVESPSPVSQSSASSSKAVSHLVQSGETKFSIAKKYGISVAELERQNPSIVSGLQAGATVLIRPGAGQPVSAYDIPERPKPAVQEIVLPAMTETQVVKTIKRTGFANYEVKPGETLFGLSQMFNISQQELINLNPTLRDGVRTGMILKVPGQGTMEVETRKDYTDLTKVPKSPLKRKMVMLLPFNASKLQADSTQATAERLKKDAFLNLTLDFYSGVLMAIDSAKTLGLNIDVSLYDSEENKNNSNVSELLKAGKFKHVDAVIGPFYQQHAESLARELIKDSIPVISPLSNSRVNSFNNLYQSMPTEARTRRVMMDYLTSKGGNIIVVSDPKRQSTKEFLNANYPGVLYAQVDDSGTVSATDLKSKLVAGKINYVILDTEKTGMILATTNLLLNEISNFKIQLAIIEPNDTLDFEEISMKRLTILKLIYPSMTRDNASEPALAFREAYKAKNRVFPNQFATRGFDVTFDTMLRVAQAGGFENSAKTQRSEQVESKFDYVKKDIDGYINGGVYILQYNEDMTVQEAE